MEDNEYQFYSEGGARIAALVAHTIETAYLMDIPIEDLLTATDMAIDQLEVLAEAQMANTH